MKNNVCPNCGGKMYTSNTRHNKIGTLRYRYCACCPTRFTTMEIPTTVYRELLKAKEVKDE